jgi:hypothetical protein
MRLLTLWAIAIAAVLSSAACTMNQTEVPPLTGPSTFATAVTVSANPDVINLGLSTKSAGQSSLIIVKVFDDKGQPKANQALRLDTVVNGILEDCGNLQARNLTTDVNGQASTLFTAPGIPVPLPECTTFVIGDEVTIRATPVGTNAQGSHFSSTSVRLVSPTFITPIGGLVVNFTISPITAKIFQSVTFSDAGSSSPGHTITSYQWTFGDGTSKSGSSVTHDFGAAGEYNVTLAITDDIGQFSFKTASITITP